MQRIRRAWAWALPFFYSRGERRKCSYFSKLLPIKVNTMTVDYAALGDAVTTQLTAVMPEALTIMGILLGITVGVKFLRRFVK